MGSKQPQNDCAEPFGPGAAIRSRELGSQPAPALADAEALAFTETLIETLAST